ncbi:GGDEF domain-containing protein [Frateuria aurantia]
MPSPLRLEPEEAARLSRMEDSWHQHLSAAPSGTLELLAALPEEVIAELAQDFYLTLLDDTRASRFLTYEDVRQRLKPALVRWLQAVFTATPGQAHALAEINHRAGALHARIELPVDLMSRGFRILRHRLALALQAVQPDPALAYAAMRVANESMDIALEGMSFAYVAGYERSARSDATYRLFSLMRNASMERERQRASLLDWENSLLYAMASGGQLSALGNLAGTEFGRWFTHKGAPSFGDYPAVDAVFRAMEEIDRLLPQLSAADDGRLDLLEAIRQQLAGIRQSLNVLFEQASELDSGTDSLTSLLNRRFLASVLRREIQLADRENGRFTVLMLDIDHFKAINDQLGHAAGDAVLRHVADLLTQHTRSSDYLFRLGGEEFLAVLIDSDEARGVTMAEHLCQRLASSPLEWNGRDDGIAVTTSIGVAVYDGHPDYERLLKRADGAMYRAKQSGRNRICVDGSGAGTR